VEPFSNGAAEEVKAAREAVSSLQQLRRFEFLLILLTCLTATLSMAFSGWNSARTRQFGQVISDCTTPKGRCYEENRKSSLSFRSDIIDRLGQVQEAIEDTAQCIALQLIQHRDANELAHRLEAKQHGYTYIAPTGEQPIPIPSQLKDACNKFLTPAEGGTK